MIFHTDILLNTDDIPHGYWEYAKCVLIILPLSPTHKHLNFIRHGKGWQILPALTFSSLEFLLGMHQDYKIWWLFAELNVSGTNSFSTHI